jgi:hypothetical protein
MCPTSDFFHFWNFRNSKLTKINFYAVPKFQFLDYKVSKSAIKNFFLPFYFRLPIFLGSTGHIPDLYLNFIKKSIKITFEVVFSAVDNVTDWTIYIYICICKLTIVFKYFASLY